MKQRDWRRIFGLGACVMGVHGAHALSVQPAPAQPPATPPAAGQPAKPIKPPIIDLEKEARKPRVSPKRPGPPVQPAAATPPAQPPAQSPAATPAPATTPATTPPPASMTPTAPKAPAATPAPAARPGPVRGPDMREVHTPRDMRDGRAPVGTSPAPAAPTESSTPTPAPSPAPTPAPKPEPVPAVTQPAPQPAASPPSLPVPVATEPPVQQMRLVEPTEPVPAPMPVAPAAPIAPADAPRATVADRPAPEPAPAVVAEPMPAAPRPAPGPGPIATLRADLKVEPIAVKVVEASKGQVEVRRVASPAGDAAGAWEPLAVADLGAGLFEVRTGLHGRAVLELGGVGDGYRLEVGRLSRLIVHTLRAPGDDPGAVRAVVTLARGRIEVLPAATDGATQRLNPPVSVTTPDTILILREAMEVAFDAAVGTRTRSLIEAPGQ